MTIVCFRIVRYEENTIVWAAELTDERKESEVFRILLHTTRVVWYYLTLFDACPLLDHYWHMTDHSSAKDDTCRREKLRYSTKTFSEVFHQSSFQLRPVIFRHFGYWRWIRPTYYAFEISAVAYLTPSEFRQWKCEERLGVGQKVSDPLPSICRFNQYPLFFF